MSSDANHSGGEPDAHPNHYLREWREFMGWSQEELGAMADVHYSKISRIENGKRELKASFLGKLARIFRVPASAILEINPVTEQGAQTAELLLVWSDLDPQQRRDVLKMIRALSPRSPQSDAG